MLHTYALLCLSITESIYLSSISHSFSFHLHCLLCKLRGEGGSVSRSFSLIFLLRSQFTFILSIKLEKRAIIPPKRGTFPKEWTAKTFLPWTGTLLLDHRSRASKLHFTNNFAFRWCPACFVFGFIRVIEVSHRCMKYIFKKLFGFLFLLAKNWLGQQFDIDTNKATITLFS